MKLTTADHVLIAGIALVAAPRRFPADPVDAALTLSILRDALPAASRGNPHLAPLIEAAELAVRNAARSLPPGAAEVRAAAAIDGWNRRRLALAWDAFQGADA